MRSPRDLAAPTAEGPAGPVLRLLPGPRRDWFAGDALAVLAAGDYEVMSASNRTALRLAGPPLARATGRDGELPSEGLVPGAVQIPGDGRPVLFLVDHPVTGGYPVVAVVCDADLDLAAQLRPGDPVRFRSGSLRDRLRLT